MKKVVSIVGARPQFIKLAPLAALLDVEKNIEHIIVHTGQHYDDNMSQVFFDSLSIRKPDYHFSISGTTHTTQTAEIMLALEKTFVEVMPDIIIVFGDTNTTLAAALVATKMHIPIMHIEAGLRSFDRSMPEEVNRVITDHVSNYLSCASQQAKDNLIQEGLEEKAHVDGDIMVDTLYHFLPIAQKNSSIFKKHNIVPGEYVLMTLHRDFNVDDKMRLQKIVDAVVNVSLPIVFPLHPRTKKQLVAFDLFKQLQEAPHVTLIEPVGYIDMLCLLDNAKQVMTDSGGLQKEAYVMKKPCITLRPHSEWVETIDSGWNVLVCNKDTGVIDAPLFNAALTRNMVHAENTWTACYGDGHTASRIVEAIKKYE